LALGFCSFICQVTSTTRQRRKLFAVFETSYHLLLSVYNHSKVEAIPLSDLPKDTTSELAVSVNAWTTSWISSWILSI